jgi:SAM-dependent methyltransferase
LRSTSSSERTSIQDVDRYWNEHPIFSLELAAEPGTPAFFEAVDRLKRTDVERFGLPFWGFDRCEGLKVLELGCGSGWLSTNYARGGARLVATDLTERAVELTRRCLEMSGLRATVHRANAEALPFETGSFDLVVASGIIHHTPRPDAAAREIGRVLRPGGTARISVYYRNVLLQPYSFWLTRRVARLLSITSRAFGDAETVDDFTRRYDGDANPLGRAYSSSELRSLFGDLRVRRTEVHYFPTRFLPIARAGGPLHRGLDRSLGTMLYAEFVKEATSPATD